jgi:la-related protein 4
MNQDMFVPVKVIAAFRMVKTLSEDMDLILSVMRTSSAVEVDETGTFVRPAVKSFRNTLVLRDIPITTNPEV